MPLDSGAVAQFDAAVTTGRGRTLADRVPVTLNPEGSIGAALREVREARELSLEQISALTRVRPAHLQAIEALDVDKLPSRPFAIGYVRAYAQALQLNADEVVARFRTEAPEPEEALRAPVGVRHNTSRRFGSLAAVAVFLTLGVVIWNFARHAVTEAPLAVETPREASVATPPKPTAGPAVLGAPLPAPPEASTPAPYETPGLAAANAAGGSADAAIAAAAAAKAAGPTAADPNLVGQPFRAGGTIYGAPSGNVILQARNSTAIIVRGGDTVYFARQLAAGEAWRAPPGVRGLTVDVGAPASVQVFVGGISKGVLSQPTTTLSAFGG